MKYSQKEAIESIIRVNHAGEYGAKRIYEGQLALLRGKPAYETVRHMKEQELVHLSHFEQEIRQRKVRPTALLPVWHVGGWVLGAATAAMGEKAAYACTVAVESVINEHYQSQHEHLDECEQPLKAAIEQFRQEEMEHHDTSLEQGAKQAAAYPVLYRGIRGITKAAIALSKRI